MTQRGFTLIEILVAVALIGVLAAIAVMSFGKQTRKARGSEVNAMFAALRVAQEQYHLENGTYVSMGSEGLLHPLTPGPQAQALTPMPGEWTTARVALPFERGYCGYAVVAGRGGSAVGIGAKANEFGLSAAPNADWYYLYAKCDLDGNGARDSHYFSWSGDTRIQKQNEGY